ncbi:hypothetical protein HTV45_08805 [Streptomyces sp. CHD11]|uniref:hypothetical protein n=1 Tax=Streptomyces sp. CHD11 TaxID=2741325 RepID=UPI001BFC54A4|nr:hypothetical protein [Streptomyces sp. CHD11]MBT3150987.1 hypothetical protein [Streptomyces sp. CHD11]
MTRNRTRFGYGAGLAVAAVSLTMLTAAPATAASDSWYRDCRVDSKYTAELSAHVATTKKSGGSCEGHAYVRIMVDGKWGTWGSGSKEATRRSPVYRIEKSQHKDCNCSTANVITLTR